MALEDGELLELARSIPAGMSWRRIREKHPHLSALDAKAVSGAARVLGAQGGQVETSNPVPTSRTETTGVEITDTDPDPGYEYEFRQDAREYVFTFPGRTGAVILPEAVVEQMLVDYTGGHTMEEVARANNLTRGEFHGVKRAMGWTKSSLPILREQAQGMTVDEVADHLLASKLREAEVKANRAHWRRTLAKAAKWDAYQEGTLQPLQEAIEAASEGYTPPDNRVVVRAKLAKRYALVISPTDLHVGKLHNTINGGGPSARLFTARDRLTAALTEVLAHLPCPPETIYLQVGGDWFNVDNSLNTTTRGTPQDSAGTPPAIWAEGSTLARDAVNILAEVAPVEVVHVPGNHDRMLGQTLADYLAAWFRSDCRVRVHPERSSYVAKRYGHNLLMFHHGDGVGDARVLAGLMADSFPREWGQTRHRYAILGHLHHTKVQRTTRTYRRRTSETVSYDIHEDRGIITFTLPSLGADDRYHVHKGYTMTQPALLALAFDYHRGWFMDVRSAVQEAP